MTTTADVPTIAGYDPETSTAPNFLLAAWRRWPWVLIGILIGTAAGFLGLYLARPPVYQSTSQVLVVKNRPDLAGMDSRVALMDDYVATQVTLVKSERILAVAAQKISPDRVENPYLHAMAAEADPRKAKLLNYLQGQLSVAREKDANAPVGGTNVLNLSVKGANSRDCQYLLEQVIDAYKKELLTIYDAATDSKIKQHTSLIQQFEQQKNDLNATRLKAVEQVSRITPEDVSIIRARVSKLTDLLRDLDAEKRDLNGKLELIKVATSDPQARTLILAQISDPGRGQIQAPLNKLDVDNPEGAIRTLEFEKAESERIYGPDHRLIQGIDAKIAFLRDLSRKSGGKDPKDPSVPFDALTVHAQVLAFRLKEVEIDHRRTLENLNDDTSKVTQATAIQNTIEETARRIMDFEGKIQENKSLLTSTMVTRGAGGLEATDINKPSLSDEPVAPRLSQALLLGAAGGLLLGLALAALAELADKSFRSPAEIRSRLGLPVIGHIPPIRLGLAAEADAGVEPAVVCATRPKSVEAEAYRGVRTSLYFSLAGRGHQVIQVTSPNPGDGKSTLAANLSVSAAQSGKRVLLIDCDFRRPRQHKIFRLADPGPGFAAVIIGEATLAQAVQRTSVENLAVLPCGARPANPAELLTSPQFAAVLDQAKAEYDYVVLDTPPLLAVSDPSVVAPRADGVVLVFRMTNRARPQAERAREQLAQLGANVLGVVVNGAGRATDGYGYGSGAGYHYDYQYEYADYHDEPDDEAAVVPKKG